MEKENKEIRISASALVGRYYPIKDVNECVVGYKRILWAEEGSNFAGVCIKLSNQQDNLILLGYKTAFYDGVIKNENEISSSLIVD